MITITFDFPEREETDLQQLNAMLATMKLKKLKLEDFETYLCTTSDGKGKILGYRLGLDSGKLICIPAEDDQESNIYQIDCEVVEYPMESDQYVDCWRSAHPDQVVRTLIAMDYNGETGFVVLHHQKK